MGETLQKKFVFERPVTLRGAVQKNVHSKQHTRQGGGGGQNSYTLRKFTFFWTARYPWSQIN